MNKNNLLLTEELLDGLRDAYSQIKRVKTESVSYRWLIEKLDTLPQETLKQLAAARIPFVSRLALNRIKK